MRAILLVAALVALGACQAEPSPAERKAADERAIAQVEAAQNVKPPVQPIELEPITPEDIEASRLAGAGCVLIPSDAGTRLPVLLLDGKRASFKLSGRMQLLAGDPGSAKLPVETPSRYAGKKFAMVITKADGTGERVGDQLVRYPASVVIRDPWDQLVYKRDAALECQR